MESGRDVQEAQMRALPSLARLRFGFRLLASPLFCIFTICDLIGGANVCAQTNAPPADAHEMVTRDPRTLTKPAERSAALDLMDRARKSLNLLDITTAYELKISFETNGATQMERDWTMDEVSDGQMHWRWTAQLGDSRVTRIGAEGHVYGTSASEPVPLRVQLVRSALHLPISRFAGGAAIRQADVERDGKTISCLLLSAMIPPNPAPRSWVER